MLIVPRWLGALVVLGLTFWWALGLAVAGPGGDSLRLALAAIYALAGLAAVVGLVLERGWRPALAVYGVALLAVLGWWLSLRPSNERAWTPEVARLAHATIQGDLVTVHDIRNFDYRSETDFTPAYYDRTFDVRKLDTLDLLPVYWMGPAIAHMLVSFGFGTEGFHGTWTFVVPPTATSVRVPEIPAASSPLTPDAGVGFDSIPLVASVEASFVPNYAALRSVFASLPATGYPNKAVMLPPLPSDGTVRVTAFSFSAD